MRDQIVRSSMMYIFQIFLLLDVFHSVMFASCKIFNVQRAMLPYFCGDVAPEDCHYKFFIPKRMLVLIFFIPLCRAVFVAISEKTRYLASTHKSRASFTLLQKDVKQIKMA